MSEIEYPDREPPCSTCRHFCVRMGDAFPYTCLLWEFKLSGNQYPSRMVFSSTGKHCPYYLKRLYHPQGAAAEKPEPAAPAKKESEVDFTV